MLQSLVIREVKFQGFELSEAQRLLQSTNYISIKQFCSLHIAYPVFIFSYVKLSLFLCTS
jgi:hypothetical protein